ITYTGLYGYIREENKKVYTRELNNQFETMIYDFDVQIGDSIQFQYGATVVDSIDTQIFYGKERDVFFVTHENTQIKDVWIEGIGSQEFPIMLSLTPNFGASGMMFHEYSYNYSTQEIFPTDKTPKPEFSYPEHEYIPFIENGKVWVDYDYQGNYKQVGINDTIVINQKKYHKLYKEEFCAWGGTQTPTRDSQLHGYIREEDKRVYVRGVNNEQECLIYDFGVQAGDTIEWATITYTWADGIHKRYIAVDSILTTSYYGKERNVYYVTCIEREFDKNGVENLEHGPMYFDDVWIEGIGTLQHPIMSLLDDIYRWGATGMEYFNYCYNYNTEEIFPTDKTPKPEFSYPEHKYIPLISPSNEWVEYGYKHYTQYTVGEMVELYGKNYYTINMTELSLPDQVISHSTYKSYYREEGKKVYMLNVDEDFLVFDFGANTGDTVILKPLYENQERKIIIDSIETTTLNGKERNVYYVDYGYDTDVWIEGIGPIHSFLFCEEIRWGSSGYSYLHYYYDNSTQYIYPEDREVIDFSAVHTLQADARTLTLHRVGDALVAVFPTASAGEAITLYDATGRVVATQAVRPGATTATIDVAALPAGVYIARMGNGATSKIVI
ncbi:MAG: T9SS type A sorting domain-containing protein, partial [Bacteroidaceae bacterium]|nr:T9SS type A sorting domain-containing protein [Bacteroidaceae bacterium]